MNPRTLFVLSVGLFLALPSAGAPPADEQKKAATPTPPAPAPVLADLPMFDTEAIGEKQIADYQKVCLDSGRRLLIVFGTNDCAPCRVFGHALHKGKFFEPFISQFVPVFVDVSSGTNASLLLRYNINPHAELPGIVILMPDARIIEILAQGEMAALTRKGDDAIQNFFLSRFLKNTK